MSVPTQVQSQPNINEIINRIGQSNPNDAKFVHDYIANIHNKNVVALGTDEAFALRDDTGEIRAFKQSAYLSEATGTLIKPGPTSPFVISAQGYEVWADAVGASCIFPKEVLVGDKWCPNPYAERDPKNNRIIAVHARAVAFMFSSKGIPQVQDWTTIFDTPAYRLLDLLAKAKRLPQAFRLMPKGMNPEIEGTWACYPFDDCTDLYVNTTHSECLQWYSQIINREKKAIDFAQTFAKRNALKHLSGLQKAPGPEWTLSVICWRPINGNIIKWDATQYKMIQEKVGALIEGDNQGFESVQVTKGLEKTSEDTQSAQLEKSIDPEDQKDVIDIQPTEPAPDQPPQATVSDESKVNPHLEVTNASFPQEYEQALNNLGLTNTPSLTNDQAEAVYNEVSRIIDQQNAGD